MTGTCRLILRPVPEEPDEPEVPEETTAIYSIVDTEVSSFYSNGAVIALEFGDKKADAAKCKLKQLFPNREVILLNIDCIAAGSGGIHCTAQQEPKV